MVPVVLSGSTAQSFKIGCKTHRGGSLATSMASHCSVCAEHLTAHKRRLVECSRCGHGACVACVQRYLLSTAKDPHCMSCRAEYSHEFVASTFTKAFLSGAYKAHRQATLLERERARMPETQPMVQRELRRRKLEASKRPLVAERGRLLTRMREIAGELRALNSQISRVQRGDPSEDSAQRRQFVRACPAPDCRGFLTTAWKCGLCQCRVCPDCHEVRQAHAEHVCNPDNVASARTISRDSKPCPSCGSLIHKIDGCFATNTAVLMADGSSCKLAQDIQVGDRLAGDDGQPRRVLRIMSGRAQLFDVRQSGGGAAYTVTGRHKLVLQFCGDREIRWVASRGAWRLTWFDAATLTTNVRLAIVTPNLTVEAVRAKLEAVRDTLTTGTTVDITVEDFLRLHPSTQGRLMGCRVGGCRHSITVTPAGEGAYYGWEVDGNHHFCLQDGTVVSNCDQMWCTSCKTAWSWRTGEVDHGPVHNPHWYQWQRQQQERGAVERELGDVPCGGVPHMTEIRHAVSAVVPDPLLRVVECIHRCIVHVEMAEVHPLAHGIRHGGDNTRLRVQYMLHELSEDAFKAKLAQQERQLHKMRATYDVLHLFVVAGSDMLRQLMVAKDVAGVHAGIRQLEQLRLYCNEEMCKIGRRFSMVVPLLHDTWRTPLQTQRVQA